MLHTFLAFMLAATNTPSAGLPSADDVVATLVERDSERRSALRGYTSERRYILENVKHQKRAEMLVRMVQHVDGSKDFEVISATGWGGARKHVFSKLLEAEKEASRPRNPEDSRVTPENYSFSMLRAEEVDGRRAYVIAVSPRRANKYLVRGTVWVDAEDFAIVRMEGTPAKSPSFWIKSVRFSHTYEKHGEFWLAASDTSVSDARIFGPTDLRIDYFHYALDANGAEARLR